MKRSRAIGEVVEINLEDMRTYLPPEKFEDFMKLRKQLDEYQARATEFLDKSSSASKVADELGERATASQDPAERLRLLSERVRVLAELPCRPREPACVDQHDRYVELVQRRKLQCHNEKETRLAMEQLAEERAGRIEAERRRLASYVEGVISSFKKSLAREKRPTFAYPLPLAQYAPHDWCPLDLPTTGDIENWATPIISKRIPDAIRSLVSWDVTGELLATPYGEYEYAGVPCISWSFRVQVLAVVVLGIKETALVKEFDGGICRIPVRAQRVGVMYVGPVEFAELEGFRTPLALLRQLTQEEPEGPGIQIVSHGHGKTAYRVAGFDSPVDIRTQFAKFVKSTGEGQSFAQFLSALGLVDEGTARLIEAKWKEPLTTIAQPTGGAESNLDAAVAKLTQMGWSEHDAKTAVHDVGLSESGNPAPEEIVKMILGKS